MIIITAGCSFSLTDQNQKKHIKTWPNYLSEEYGATLISKAMGSQGKRGQERIFGANSGR